MKVVAVNTSPRRGEGQTALVFDPFVQGMRDAGAEVEVIFARDLDIRPCDGDFRCWWTTPGTCRYRDDMDRLLPLFRSAEIWVLGIPVFLPMPGEAQNVLNRLMPLYTSSLRIRGRRMYPARAQDVRLKSIALVSSCGYWELENFEKLVRLVEEIADASDAEFVRPVLRPHATAFAQMIEAGDEAAGSILGAAREAGRELVATGAIAAQTCDAVAAPLVSFEEYVQDWDSGP